MFLIFSLVVHRHNKSIIRNDYKLQGNKMKYQVTINKETGLATIKNNETNVSVVATVHSYTRMKNDKPIKHFQLKFDPTLLECENKGIVQIPKYDNGKFKLTFETNLTSKNESSMELGLDILDMFA